MLQPFEERMLSGEPFTTEDLMKEFAADEEGSRKIERAIRRFHREGLIEHKRAGLKLTWIATEAGKKKAQQVSE